MLKKVLTQFLKSNPLLTILIVVGLFFHFYYLNTFPIGLTHDDADVVVSMKTIADSRVDVSGVGFPKLLFFNKTQGNISGLASYLISPIYKIIEPNLLNIHFIYVIINICSVILISYLVYLLTKNEKIPIFIFLVGLFNPWMFAYSRYPTEAPVALFFVLLALVSFFWKFKGNIIFSTLFFVLSFYSYYGAKIAVIALFPTLITFKLFSEGLSFHGFKKYLIPIVLFLLFTSTYFGISMFNKESTLSKRLGSEFIFQNINQYQQKTDDFRKISLDSGVKRIFFNKYIFAFENIAEKYIGWLSPNILFFEGDPVSVYKFSNHGLFYFVDIILFIFGFIYLVLNYKNLKSLIMLGLVLLLIAPIGSSLSNIGTSYFFRSFLLLIPLLILLGIGLYSIEVYLSKNKKQIFWYLFLFTYLLSFFRFLTFYFVRYPVYAQENNFLSERILSSYIKRSTGLGKISLKIVNVDSFLNLFKFYTGKTTDDLNVSSDCYLVDNSEIAIYDSVLSCPELKEKYLVISNQKDSGAIFKIYNDKLCKDTSLTPYKRDHKLEDYNIESLSNDEFCNRWIQRY